jgi:DNA mismatch repair ATPase MutL
MGHETGGSGSRRPRARRSNSVSSTGSAGSASSHGSSSTRRHRAGSESSDSSAAGGRKSPRKDKPRKGSDKRKDKKDKKDKKGKGKGKDSESSPRHAAKKLAAVGEMALRPRIITRESIMIHARDETRGKELAIEKDGTRDKSQKKEQLAKLQTKRTKLAETRAQCKDKSVEQLVNLLVGVSSFSSPFVFPSVTHGPTDPRIRLRPTRFC